ncbi:MAG: GPW/gp25 family protein [Burkholderiaceae bacterium]|nr:GPW/gp25 family protein [Burkholderiaceae bacterium]
MPQIASNLDNLTTRFAQCALSTAVTGTSSIPAIQENLLCNRLGQMVTDADDINQCLHIIFLTPKGSDVHRPLFGCDWYKWIDSPVNVARPHIVREITDAIKRWEPRIVLVRVQLLQMDEINMSHKKLVLDWRFADGVAEQMFSSNISLSDLLSTLGGVVQ